MEKVKVTMEMPVEAVGRLLQAFRDDPEGLKKRFKDAGFDLLDIVLNVQKPAESESLPNSPGSEDQSLGA